MTIFILKCFVFAWHWCYVGGCWNKCVNTRGQVQAIKAWRVENRKVGVLCWGKLRGSRLLCRGMLSHLIILMHTYTTSKIPWILNKFHDVQQKWKVILYLVQLDHNFSSWIKYLLLQQSQILSKVQTRQEMSVMQQFYKKIFDSKVEMITNCWDLSLSNIW